MTSFKATPEQDKALSKAKIGLMSHPNSVFFSTICMGLPHHWNDKIPTARTDHKSIEYNPEFFMEQTPIQRIGLVLHETLHVAFLHSFRFETLEPRFFPLKTLAKDKFSEFEKCLTLFNQAADYVINLIIIDAKFELPEPRLLERKYEGMSVEQVYDDLKKNPPNSGCDVDFMKDLCICGDGDTPDITAEQRELIKAEVDDMLIQAAIASQMQGDSPGSIPGHLEFYINELVNPKVPWHRILRSFITKRSKTDYSFRKPNRRFFPKYIMPTLFSETMCDIACGTDTSCSVTDKEYGCYVSEVMSIIKGMRPEKTTYIQFDTSIKSVNVLKNLNDLKQVEFLGRGGTNINPLMQWALENKPAVLIVFTDGHFDESKINPKVPVVWVIHDNPGFKAPFGKIVHYEIT